MKLIVDRNLDAVIAAYPALNFHRFPADSALNHQAAWIEQDDEVQADEVFCLSEASAKASVKLALFDMDSTLIPHECIDEIAREAGVVSQVAEVTERAMQGELDFAQSFKTRMALLKGTPVSVLDQIADRLELMPGATALMAELRAAGARTVLVSGGFTFFAKNVAGQLGMDEFHANPLEQQEGVLTGEVHSQILDATRKAEILSDVAQLLGIDRSQIMATGDGANDLKMIALADKGVAYHAKPKVQEAAPLAVRNLDLSALVWLVRWSQALA